MLCKVITHIIFQGSIINNNDNSNSSNNSNSNINKTKLFLQ